MVRKSSIIDDIMDTPQIDNPFGSTCATSMDLKSEFGHESIMLDKSSIQNLFFGKVTQILKVDNSERQKIISQKVNKMGPIMLEMNNYSNLSDAWNGSSLEEIEDYNYKEVAASFF